MALLDRALAGAHIASAGYGLVVVSPHQNNFEMPLRVEEWNAPPPADDGDWDEVFESHLTVVGGVLRYESPTMEAVPFEVPDGRYAVRISGRGFRNRGWPGSTTPGDSWRVQLWPSADVRPDRRVKEWQPTRPGTH